MDCGHFQQMPSRQDLLTIILSLCLPMSIFYLPNCFNLQDFLSIYSLERLRLKILHNQNFITSIVIGRKIFITLAIK